MQNHRPECVRRYDDGVDLWEMGTAPPAAALVGWVAQYSGYVERTASFSARRELAATCGVLVYALGEPLSITGADGIEIILKAGDAFVGGIADATSISRALGPQRGLQVHMPLHSLAMLTGAPVAEIANRVVPLADMIGDQARDLGHALGSARARLDQFDLLDDFFVRRLADAVRPDRAVAWAMTQLGAEDAPAVDTLAKEIGWSRKHLTSRFKAVTGFSPQSYRRLARFERFSALIARSPRTSLAMLALDAGYHDQPHMTREVRGLSAMTPGELRARLIPEQGGVRDG